MDGRTRHSHAKLDGETIDTNKTFSNGCKYPGDPDGVAEEIYNCRCTLIAVLDDAPSQNAQRIARSTATGKNYVVKDMTYQEWESGKIEFQKHMKEFVDSAPCITTEKKFTDYLLKPNAKHSKEFYDVGYTKDDALQLRYDIASKFDINNATEIRENADGTRSFSLFMDLGITKKKPFRTVWFEENDNLPRIITAYREDMKK